MTTDSYAQRGKTKSEKFHRSLPYRHAWFYQCKFMDLKIQTIGNNTFLIGETFPAKDIIKRHGGRWDGFRQGWAFNDLATAQACADEVEPHLVMMKELEALDAM